VPVTTGHPEDGCHLRAHLWGLRLARMGAHVRKIFVARADPELSVWSATAAGATDANPHQVSWSAHVAPVVEVAFSDGRVGWAVFDPALMPGIVTDSAWIAATGVTENYRLLDGRLEAVTEEVRDSNEWYPNEWTCTRNGHWAPREAVVVVTDLHAVYFPHPGNWSSRGLAGADRHVRQHEHSLALHNHKDLHRQLARLVRSGIEQDLPQDVQVERLAKAVQDNPVRFGFLERDPGLRDQLLGAWSPEHSARLPELLPASSDTDTEADDAAAERQSWTGHFAWARDVVNALPDNQRSTVLTHARTILQRLLLCDLRLDDHPDQATSDEDLAYAVAYELANPRPLDNPTREAHWTAERLAEVFADRETRRQHTFAGA
jgi:hypothetical protein